MIYITYREKDNKLTIKGHAYSAEEGKDTICAAVSFSFYNLVQMLLEYDQEKAFAVKPKFKDNKGSAYISCTASTGYEDWIAHDFFYALTGFELLATQYPDYVNLKIVK